MIKSSEDAVSPVVGVMLMLVVTIILAAVVSGFTGGLVGNTQAAPKAAIDVEIDSNSNLGMDMGYGTQVFFTLLSGDSIPTKDLSIITYYTNDSGHVYKHEQNAQSDPALIYGYYPVVVPFLNDLSRGYAYNTPGVAFGNFTWSTGDIMATEGNHGSAALLGLNIASGEINEPDFGTGSVVDVKILHNPSGQYIFDKEVVVL